MFLKGILYTLYKNKLVKFYPKTLAEQVLIDRSSTTTLLDKLVNIKTGEVITDPDKAIDSGQTYIINNSTKMPTTDKYAVTTLKYDDISMYQQAVDTQTQKKIERWCSEGKWGNWEITSNDRLTLSSVSIKCDIENNDIYTFKNPIIRYDETIQHISALIINTSYLTLDKFDVKDGNITIHDTENTIDKSDEVYVILHQLVKTDGIFAFNFDGSRIAPKTITGDKISDDAFMTSDDIMNHTGNNKIVGRAAIDKVMNITEDQINNIMTELSTLKNELLDTGWIPLVLNNGLTVGQMCQVRKIGKMIFIEGTLKGVSVNNTILLTLPSGFRTVSKTLLTRFTNGVGEVSTNPAGVLTFITSKVGTITSNDDLEINLSFIAYDA